MNLQDAKKIAQADLDESYEYDGTKRVIVDEFTRGKNFGWVFFYQSAKYFETLDPLDCLAGNLPLLSTSKLKILDFQLAFSGYGP